MGLSQFPMPTGSRITQSTTAPLSPVAGDLWLDTDAVAPSGTTAFADYTPSNTGVTVGDGTQVARWCRVGTGAGSLIVVRYSITFGSTTSFAATTEFGLPVAANGTGRSGGVNGSGYTLNAGVAEFIGTTVLVTGSTQKLVILRHSDGAAWSNTIPHTFGSGDVLTFSVSYEAAA